MYRTLWMSGQKVTLVSLPVTLQIDVSSYFSLNDLCYAASNSTYSCQRTIAGIFLEMAFNPQIRAQMTARNSPGIHLYFHQLTGLLASSDW